MLARISLRKVLRDSSIILFGAMVGILLARTLFETRPGCEQKVLTKRVRLDEAPGGPNGRPDGGGRPREPKSFHKKQQPSTPLRRPKTLREELQSSIRKPLLIGVVTARKLLSTRAAAVNRTWGSKAPKLLFFSSQDETHSDLPIVSLPGVDDTYPPQKKVYRMLKYMYDNYINEYSWFMRADDDIYVRVEHLMQFLSNLDPTKELYIGQPGLGKAEDLQRIKLQPQEHYCMGGPGVIFSRALLEKLGPHLEDCLQHEVVSWNEDLEVGRCISRRLGIQCTWNYEVCARERHMHPNLTKGVCNEGSYLLSHACKPCRPKQPQPVWILSISCTVFVVCDTENDINPWRG